MLLTSQVFSEFPYSAGYAPQWRNWYACEKAQQLYGLYRAAASREAGFLKSRGPDRGQIAPKQRTIEAKYPRHYMHLAWPYVNYQCW